MSLKKVNGMVGLTRREVRRIFEEVRVVVSYLMTIMELIRKRVV